MLATHNDLEELIKFSIENNVASAITSYRMFSPEQIRRLYEISIPQRRHLLQEWASKIRQWLTSCTTFTVI